MAIPVEANEIAEFTPASLINVPDAPVFRLRAPDERNMRRYQQMCEDRNLLLVTQRAIDAVTEAGITQLYSEEEASEIISRYRTLRAQEEQKIEVSAADEKWLALLDETIRQNYEDSDTGVKPLAVLYRKQNQYWRETPELIISTMVVGWKNLDLPFRLDAGYLKIVDVTKLSEKLIEIEESAKQQEVEGVSLTGIAVMELWTECLTRSRMTEDEEKNLPAPSLPSLSQEDSSKEVNGASIAESGKDENISSSLASTQTPKSGEKDASSETQKSE